MMQCDGVKAAGQVKVMCVHLKLGALLELGLYHSLSEEFLSVLMEKAIH